MTTKPFSFDEFLSIYSKVPRICVEIVVKTKKGIILTKRAIIPWKGYWHLPGSTVLLNEKLEDTAKRVAREELGLEVSVEKMLGITESITKSRDYPNHGISVIFLVNPDKGNVKLDGQASELKLFTNLPKKIIPSHRNFLKAKLNIH